MLRRCALLLALTLLAAGCASQRGPVATEYSGSEVATGPAVERCPIIFVGKILTSEFSTIPSNTFFTEVQSTVRVIQPIRGQTGDVVTVGYSLSGGTSLDSPFHNGDLCIFGSVGQSLVERGVYQVLKILPATPENIAEVQREASSH